MELDQMIPRATLVAKTVAIVETSEGSYALDAGDFVAYAARVSNPSNQLSEWSYAKLLAYLQRAKHWSPFEMSNAVIECVTTRDISHQVIRHHSFRFQEFSQRYAEATGFHIHEARRQDTKNRQNSLDDLDEETKAWWRLQQEMIIDYSSNAYKAALARGIAKECARKVLPEGLTETTFYMNGYLRSWIHYLAQRLDPSTQKEHRDLALAIDAELRREIPTIFDIEE
jgi:thymidylate synthase (FAD)